MISKCNICVRQDKENICNICKDNPKFADYPRQTYFQEYIPTCPQGFIDCVCDPAYIKFYHPEWYKELYGSMSPQEVSLTKCSKEDNCYDDEDK